MNFYVYILLVPLVAVVAANEFRKDFKFGVGSSAYQTEGARNVDGKGPSIWDFFLNQSTEHVLDGTNGNIASDGFHKINEDVALLKELGVDFYKFSISFTRLTPTGCANQLNKLGIEHYNRLIDKLIENDIEPVVELFHWDLPLKLHELGGWQCDRMTYYLEDYAKICFEYFGDRVKRWLTITNPFLMCRGGYGIGTLAPYYTADGIGDYFCGHHVLLAHAKVVELYRKSYKPSQHGTIGIGLDSAYFEPYTDSKEDKNAAEAMMEFYLGWFAHPIFSKEGDYPPLMRHRIDKLSKEQKYPVSRLPKFTKKEKDLVRGSADFIGVHHFSTAYSSGNLTCDNSKPSFENDVCGQMLFDPKWKDTGKVSAKIVPYGLRRVLNWIKKSYGDWELVVVNGISTAANEVLEDNLRVNYIQSYLNETLIAINEDKLNVTGYSYWTFMDGFEWIEGYTIRSGLYHVDFNLSERTRTPKKSVEIYRKIIETKRID